MLFDHISHFTYNAIVKNKIERHKKKAAIPHVGRIDRTDSIKIDLLLPSTAKMAKWRNWYISWQSQGENEQNSDGDESIRDKSKEMISTLNVFSPMLLNYRHFLTMFFLSPDTEIEWKIEILSEHPE